MDLLRRDFLVKGTLMAAVATAASPALAQNNNAPSIGADLRPPPTDAPYQAGTAVKSIEIINTLELEGEAQKILPTGGFGYIASGSGAEWTKRENMAAFERVQIEPQFLSGVDKIDLTTTILGSHMSMPILIAPAGSHGLAHVSKEVGTAKAAAAAGVLMITSTQANSSMEEIAQANPGPKWFQLYFPADRGFARELIMRAKAAGYTAIVPTVDNQINYPREENLRNDFRVPTSLGKGNAPKSITDPAAAIAALRDHKIDLTWADMEWIKQETGLAVVVKGVMSPKTAAQAVRAGMDAVYVSNHGGRALDGVPATISILPRIADAVQGRVPIILDSGIRRGTDVFKALALGANAVAMGRPVLYGLALGGWMGAQSVLEYMRDNVTRVMQLAGTPNLKAIKKEFLAPNRIA